jgi:NADH dehydrogenase/NADH:ubiquinone oxidoreductase subunit G
VNAKGMVQTFVRAIPAPDGVHPAWKTLCAIAKELGLSLAYERTGDVRNDMNAAAAAADAQPQANA